MNPSLDEGVFIAVVAVGFTSLLLIAVFSASMAYGEKSASPVPIASGP
jgi:hypothetical protein